MNVVFCQVQVGVDCLEVQFLFDKCFDEVKFDQVLEVEGQLIIDFFELGVLQWVYDFCLVFVVIGVFFQLLLDCCWGGFQELGGFWGGVEFLVDEFMGVDLFGYVLFLFWGVFWVSLYCVEMVFVIFMKLERVEGKWLEWRDLNFDILVLNQVCYQIVLYFEFFIEMMIVN